MPSEEGFGGKYLTPWYVTPMVLQGPEKYLSTHAKEFRSFVVGGFSVAIYIRQYILLIRYIIIYNKYYFTHSVDWIGRKPLPLFH